MSHVRNLFQKPLAREQVRSAEKHTATEAVFTRAATAMESVAASATAVEAPPVLPEFAVAEAQITPELRLAYYSDPRGPAADRYRLLRMRLKEHWRAGKLKKLLITGPLPHDGKSTVTLNLATALAERGKFNVLVVEADLHHSGLSESLKLKPAHGLTECLTGDAQPLSAIRRIEPLGWHLLSAGEPRRNPTELLQTNALGQILQQLAARFDWILVDSPPVIPLTDSLSLQHHVDASLLVVRAEQTPRETVEQTIELLGKKNIVGIVLNGVEARNHLYYQYAYSRSNEDE